MIDAWLALPPAEAIAALVGVYSATALLLLCLSYGPPPAFEPVILQARPMAPGSFPESMIVRRKVSRYKGSRHKVC